MTEAGTQAVVWIGVAGVVPREGCELLSAGEGAFVNFLTLASSEAEFRAKVVGALIYYRLELLEFKDVRAMSESDRPSEDILGIAAELELNNDPKHVRYATFHIFPRAM